MTDYLQYPLNFKSSGLETEDLNLYKKKLDARFAGLFLPPSSPNCLVELWQPGRQYQIGGNIRQCGIEVIENVDALRIYWENERDKSKGCLIFVNRKNSWSRMKWSVEMFKYLCSTLNIHPRFLDFLFDFGRKSSPPDETFLNFFKYVSSSHKEDRSPSDTEICYNVRHFELHGRNSTDPWACRQSAIYHKLHASTGTSTWFIVQQPQSLSESLQTAPPQSLRHPMAVHIRFLRSVSHNWRDLLSEISADLATVDGTLSISKPLEKFQNDWQTVQKIHLIRKKTQSCITILAGTIDVVQNLMSCTRSEPSITPFSSDLWVNGLIELDQLATEIKNYKLTARNLLERSDDLRMMSRDVMGFVNQETVVRNGFALERLGHAGQVDNENISRIAEDTQKESRTMRIATIIAMVYLPANLVLSFFSTGLVSFMSVEEASAPSTGVHMQVHNQVWIAVVTSFILAAGTLAAVGLISHYGRGLR